MHIQRILLLSAFAALGIGHELMGKASAATKNVWIAPSAASNSNATLPTSTNYTSNFGIAFLAGAGDSGNSIDWITLGLNTSAITAGAGSLRIALRNTNNTTAYSAVAGTTEYATDLVNFTSPTTTNTRFELDLFSSDIPNISSFAMTANSAYSLIVYNASLAYGLERTSGYANGTTNGFYTTGYGFTPLDTFRNNNPNYTNISNSFPTLAISLGSITNPAPTVPGPLPLGGLAALLPSLRRLRRRSLRLREEATKQTRAISASMAAD